MIYALDTRDVSDHERREIARRIRDNEHDALKQDTRIVHVCDTNVGEECICIYCSKNVHKWYRHEKASFHHAYDEGCLESEQGLPGIENPYGVTAVCQDDP